MPIQCPCCLSHLFHLQCATSSKSIPRMGDITICDQCTATCRYADDNHVVEVADQELDAKTQAVIRNIKSKLAEIKKRKQSYC